MHTLQALLGSPDIQRVIFQGGAACKECPGSAVLSAVSAAPAVGLLKVETSFRLTEHSGHDCICRILSDTKSHALCD